VAGGVEAIARDVTDIMKLEERLMAAQKLESIGTLAGGIAHDFNNMMTIVTGYSELALRAVEPGNPIRQKLELIKETGDKAAELTHQLLAFSRKQMLQPKPVDLNATVGRVKKLLRRLIPEHIVLTTDLEPGLRTITADPDQIEQVILNLAINARDEMPTGGNLTIATKNVELDEISDEPNDQVGLKKFVRISISDAGQGMNEEAVRRIFDPYFSVQGIGRGGGLGLATVHGIVKQSGGEITVRSESGRGTTFDIVFPAMFGEEPSRASDGQPPLAKRGCGEVILVVEDDDLVRPVVMEMLNSLGYHPLLASGGAEAIAICMDQSKHVDLLLTDVIMPEMSGKQLMDELKRLRPEIKGVFMSGYTDEIVYVDGAVEPGSAFLGKPFAVSSLNEKIREVLDGDG
jgi:nitrogen-specific signal transduction histidine kinase